METKTDRYGDRLFSAIKIIGGSRFSHILIEKDEILTINAMKATYLGLQEIIDMLDERYWGIWYPVFKLYKHLRFKYRKFIFSIKYPQLRSRKRALKIRGTPGVDHYELPIITKLLLFLLVLIVLLWVIATLKQ